MKKKVIIYGIIAAIGLAIIIVFVPKIFKKQVPPPVKIAPGFSNYISGYTAGIITIKTNIRIKLASPVTFDIDPGQVAERKLFQFTPSMKGISYWIDDRTIEFRPDQLMPYGTLFQAVFLLEKIKDVPKEYEKFVFQFQTGYQNIDVVSYNITPYSNKDLSDNQFSATLSTTDFIDNMLLEKIVSARYHGKSLDIQWEHDVNGKRHKIIIDHIKRMEKDKELVLSIQGQPIGIEDKKETIEIPSVFTFKLMQMMVIQQPDQHILMQFSDPVSKSQDLRGLIHIKGEEELQYSIQNNEIKAFTPYRLQGMKKVIVEKGIKNTNGYKLVKSVTRELQFEVLKPQVKLIGEGVIMPNSNGLELPFKAVNLNAVDIKVIKIFEDNIAQFLQKNQLDGNYQLKRVGRLILKKKIELFSPDVIDYGQWNAFSADLSDLIQPDPGSVYRIELSFRKKYSLYPCANGLDEEELQEDWDNYQENEESYWDMEEDYYYYDYYYNDWEERDNPCHEAYYRNRKASRNVLASDLGIVAKSGTDRVLTVAITDLISTKPQSGIEVGVYNYQQQLINSKKTNSDGFVSIDVHQKPYLLIAKHGMQRGYLKLNDGSALSLSTFDVSGNAVQKGIKGYIYGERGVWRPGDSLFISFILQDEKNTLPENHPVIFEMTDPNGQIVKRMVSMKGKNGFYTFKTSTSSEAPTGTWISRIRVGGTVFTKPIRIESIKPNRLKINIDFGTEKLTSQINKITGNLNIKWLHGAIAGNLRAQVDMKLNETKTTFKQYPDFIFDNPAISFNAEEYTIFDDRVNDEGAALISTGIQSDGNLPGMLNATFVTRAFEEGGEFSIDQFSIPYLPYTYYVGMKTPEGDKSRGMLLTDEKHELNVITLDREGIPVSRKNLNVRIYKVHWRWWWESGNENLASYVGSNRHTPVFSKTINTDANGMGSFSFEIKHPEWGRYLIYITDPSGHSCGKTVYVDWPGWAGRGQRENPGEASMLIFSSDKDKYTVNEQAKISFPSSKGGRALVSIENGSEIVKMFWLETYDEETSFEFKISEEMAPNIYVNITLIQPHNHTLNDLPIRLYGVIPIMIENKDTKLNPVIMMPGELRSEEKFNLKVKERNSKAMTYTVAIVDEGLLGLTRYKTPDPWNTFYAREALGVKTWDLYDLVLGAYGGKIQQVFAIGGDQEIIDQGKKKADRFKPVVKFLGPFNLETGKTNIHSVKLPKYIGAVRTMIVAGDNRAYGHAEKTVQVKNPLMLLATLPRVLGPNEKVKLPVTLFAMDESIEKVKVSIETNKLFEIKGEREKTLGIDNNEIDLEFDLIVLDQTGIGKIKVTAESEKERAEYDIEIDIRASNPPVTMTFSSMINPGEEWNIEEDIFGIKGTNNAILEVSNIKPIDFGRRLKYLLNYPHGCIEQTVSSAFPQLYLSSVMHVNDDMNNKMENHIETALEQFFSFQLPAGGFSYWPGKTAVSPWGTSYAGHFMLEAEEKGYAIPVGIKENWMMYQKRAARNWNYNDYKWTLLDQAYRLYTLALAGEPEIGAMNRLREIPDKTKQSIWRLAAAYALSGKNKIALEMTHNINWDIDNYRELSHTYGSSLRDQAMILETYAILGKQNEAIPLMEKISKELSSGRWMSTQTTAYCLLAMVKFAGISELTDEHLEFSYSFNDQSDHTKTREPVQQIQIKNIKDNKIIVHVKNEGMSSLYANIFMEGIPVENTLPPANNNLLMDIQYQTLDGEKIDVGSIRQGKDIKAIINVKNPGVMGNYKEMAITQIVPSGWEIHNTRMYETGSVHAIDQPSYQDIRDDRIYTYFDLRAGDSKSFVVLLNAAYSGLFYLPSITCEAMYDNRINSRSSGQWISVVKTK